MRRPRCLRCNRCMCSPKRRRRPGEVILSGRGLCQSCYKYVTIYGKRDNYPRALRRAADVAEDVEFLQREGYTLTQIAERMGYKNRDSLTRALLRHRQRAEQAA